jgi:hypothetical protein
MTSPEPDWLLALLARNADCAYLKACGSPRTLAEFRARVPTVTYDELHDAWLPRLATEADVLFAGRPVAYERTGGSSGGSKLIPYSAEGLADFRASVVPWLAGTCRRFGIAGSVYFSLSPATRAPEAIAGVPVGLPDGAYLGDEWGAWLMHHLAVPPALMAETQVAAWRSRTLAALVQASDLEMISVWSPTFLLRLLDDLPDPREIWPRLKLVSCWADASSHRPAAALMQRLPHARLQPKGLLSTECVVTVPGDDGWPVLTPHGFYEFECQGVLLMGHELAVSATYEVIATTASGLYRYRTRDVVRCDGFAPSGAPILTFTGRAGLASDLVGEKLEEAFVDEALRDVAGFRFLTPQADGRGYALVMDARHAPPSIARVEERLATNPQYAYARRLGQLRPLVPMRVPNLYDHYVAHHMARGVRLADVKPLALVTDTSWISRSNP